MNKVSRLLSIYKRLILTVNHNNVNSDMVVLSAQSESKRYKISVKTFQRDINNLRESMIEIAKASYYAQLKQHEDFSVNVDIIEYHKGKHVYWLKQKIMSREEFENYIKEESLKKRKKQFAALTKKFADE